MIEIVVNAGSSPGVGVISDLFGIGLQHSGMGYVGSKNLSIMMIKLSIAYIPLIIFLIFVFLIPHS